MCVLSKIDKSNYMETENYFNNWYECYKVFITNHQLHWKIIYRKNSS